MPRTAWFLAVTGGLAGVIALIAGLVARWQGIDINLWTTVLTALVVGIFVAFLWIGRGDDEDEEPGAEGFEVVSRKETDVVVEQPIEDDERD